MKITVIIPCYNMEKSVADAIFSVRNQWYRNWRLVVVDDGSTDSSWEQIRMAIGDDSRCLAVRTKNMGVASARNTAISHALSEWVLPLDADDKLAPRALFEFALVASRNPHVDIVVPWVRHKSATKEWVVKRQWKGYEELKRNNHLPNSTMFRKIGWERAGGYRSGTMYEDWEFWLRLLNPGSKVASLPIPVIEYAVRPDSRVHQAINRHAEEVEIIKRMNPDIYV